MAYKENISPNFDELVRLDRMLREGRLSDPEVVQELGKRIRPGHRKGEQLVLMPQFSKKDAERMRDEGKIILSTPAISLRQLQTDRPDHFAYVNAPFSATMSVATQFALDPDNLVLNGSFSLRHSGRMQKVAESDEVARDESNGSIARIAPNEAEWAVLDHLFREANEGIPLIADREGGSLFIDAGQVDAARFVLVGRLHPDDGLNIDLWGAGHPHSVAGAPAVEVPVMRLGA